jgi:hypothetical protein
MYNNLQFNSHFVYYDKKMQYAQKQHFKTSSKYLISGAAQNPAGIYYNLG